MSFRSVPRAKTALPSPLLGNEGKNPSLLRLKHGHTKARTSEPKMKLLIASTTWLTLSAAIWSPCSAFAQTEAGRSAETKQTPGKLPDSDGDGIPDRDDPHPFIADITGVSWRISPLSLGWKADSSLEEQVSTLNQHEKEILRRKQFTFGGQADASASVESGGRGELSANPLKLFGLRDSEAHIAYGARFGVSGNVGWSQTDQETAKTLLHAVRQTQVAQRLSDLNLEFTVRFFNQSDQAFVGRKLEIPIKVGDQVVAFAQPVGANGPDLEFSIPAGREHGIPIRFRAKLDTTQSLLLLQVMQDRSPDIIIEESQGEIVGEVNGRRVDAISTLSQIRRKTCLFTVELDGREFSWSVARRDDKTGRRLHLSDLFDQVNALALAEKGETRIVFQHTGRYLRSALGRDNSLSPVRWWVIADGEFEATGRDIDLSGELPQQVRLQYQFGFPKDMSRWVKDVDAKDPWSLAVAGELLNKGLGGSVMDKNKAMTLYGKAADLGDAFSMVRLGESLGSRLQSAKKTDAILYRNGAKTEVELYRKAAALGEPLGMTYLGLSYQHGKRLLEKDDKKAVALFQKAADLGNTSGMVLLGMAYGFGEGGLAKDDKKAVALYQKAADLGDPLAMTLLGGIYGDGVVLAKDEKKAVALYQKAADLGNAVACYYLGIAYSSGKCGLEQDKKKAVPFYQRAADAGNAEAMTILGFAYQFGEGGLVIDEKKAVELYQEASGFDSHLGMKALADCYENGIGGLPIDKARAAELRAQAEKNIHNR